jgi:CheY-like chemotaxis protein
MAHKQQGFLNSWKEIAQYLGRGVRTVQRWESELGMPVRRPRGKSRSAVIAVMSELDQWLARTPLHTIENSEPESLLAITLHVLVLEENVADLNTCVTLLRKMGVAQLDAISNVRAAMLRLEEIDDHRLPKPDLIILDLSFSSDGGFEILRYRGSRPTLRSIPLIVWNSTPDSEQELCEVFDVDRVVHKSPSARELHEAVLSVRAKAA